MNKKDWLRDRRSIKLKIKTIERLKSFRQTIKGEHLYYDDLINNLLDKNGKQI